MAREPTEQEIEGAEAPLIENTPPAPAEEVQTPEDAKFALDVERLIAGAEDRRLHFMKRYRNRNFLALTLGLLAMTAGGCAFGWYFLMEADLARALGSILLAGAVPVLLGIWARGVLKAYAHDYKNNFLPQMAKILGNLQFYPSRGISAKTLAHSGLLPQHQRYIAEDCFMGRYKGVKILFSEAQLFRGKNIVFDGVLVLLEAPDAAFPGHTIVTSDERAVKSWRTSRWRKFSDMKTSSPYFQAFSTKPQEAAALVSETLLGELLETSVLFENAPVSAAFFARNRVFLAINHHEDMFEPSNIEMPVATKAHALRCKKEIERILSIVDILELYGKN